MPLIDFDWPTDRQDLYLAGRLQVEVFCKKNDVPIPTMTAVPRADWYVSACAYYRPDTEAVRKWTNPGINICLEECQHPCGLVESRNWTWPASTTDREPYGVLAHELGHHCDWYTGKRKGSYSSEYCQQVMDESGEPPITSYCPNPSEWFAEMFRVFVTNPGLLRCLRSRTYQILARRWKPTVSMDWRHRLGSNVPPRVLRALRNKGAHS